ncbi:muramidase [Sphingomonas sp. GM_Shp_2]|uniref:muramidase n=1 Tax=Sphingomonas sp. GM_Shp_2 TaxID=2937380 RepID=UPI00226AECE7|nr:muramidase [Sphingomonas sp. GM_Shp_2]
MDYGDLAGIVLPTALTSKAIQLCAALLGASASPAAPTFRVVVNSGAHLSSEPRNAADAEEIVRELLSLGADFAAGPLELSGRDLTTYGVAPRLVFDPCALAGVNAPTDPPYGIGPAALSDVMALLRQSFGARITDTIRPTNATYGAQRSWHKVGQAIDFVPAGGVGAVSRAEIRALLTAHGVQLIELLGPGDRGHANHWHIAFALPWQNLDQMQTVESGEDWIVGVGLRRQIAAADQRGARLPAHGTVQEAPPAWDVFAMAEWRALRGGG